MARVCIARIDRIGDFVITLPLQEFWLKNRPEDQIVWLAHKNVDFVTSHLINKINVKFINTPASFFEKFNLIFELRRWMIQNRLDVFLSIHVPWWVALAAFLAKVKTRVGSKSQWYAWFFLNKQLKQNRSESVKHESQYNLDLAAFALDLDPSVAHVNPVKLKAKPIAISSWKEKLRKLDVNLEKYVVIHPGMGESARNWPGANYAELAKKFVKMNYSVIVTGSKMDEDFIIKTEILSIAKVVNLVGKTSGDDLLAVLAHAKLVVAPSTGVAHLAASLDVPVAAIYSPVRVQAPPRWRPLGPRVKVFVPEVKCPGHFQCLGPRCEYFDCMSQIGVDSVLSCAMKVP